MTRLRTVFNDANSAWNNRVRAARARKLTRTGAESVELLRLYAKRLDNAARKAAGQVLRTRSRAVSTEDRERQ